MKKIFKQIIAAVFCAVIVLTSIGADSAYAAKKIPLKVTFNGKSINLLKDINSSERGDTAKIETVEETWGEPSTKETFTDPVETVYIWKKGKTTIDINDYSAENGSIGGISVSIGDKNGALYGVKVGMKEAAAIKKLNKIFGKKNVVLFKKGQELKENKDGSYRAVGKATGNSGEIYVYNRNYMPRQFGVKKGKITDISFWRE